MALGNTNAILQAGGSSQWQEVQVGTGNYTVWAIFDGRGNIMEATASIIFENDNNFEYTTDTSDIEFICFKGVTGGGYIKSMVSANDIGQNYYNRIFIRPNVVGGDIALSQTSLSNIGTEGSMYIPIVTEDSHVMAYFKWYEG